METLEIIGQIFGIIGMIFMISSYQVKNQRGLIVFQLFGAVFFFLNFLLIGIAVGMILAGMILNFIGILRCIVFSNKEKYCPCVFMKISIAFSNLFLSHFFTLVILFLVSISK